MCSIVNMEARYAGRMNMQGMNRPRGPFNESFRPVFMGFRPPGFHGPPRHGSFGMSGRGFRGNRGGFRGHNPPGPGHIADYVHGCWPQPTAEPLPGGPRPRMAGKRKHPQPQSNEQVPKKARNSKVDKRDLPENNKFFCETCDRGFKTEEKYKEHTDGHTKCNVEGCGYIAAPKLVRLHYQWQHASGLAKKIWALESKEDIDRWKAERKKNYPTAQNVAKKKEEEAERRARGEVLETKCFGRMRGRGRNRGRGRGRGRGDGCHGIQDGRGRSRSHDAAPSPNRTAGKNQEPEEGSAKKPVPDKQHDPKLDPLAYILDDKNNSEEEETATKPNGTPLLAGSLTSLAAAYGDISDSDSESDKETSHEKTDQNQNKLSQLNSSTAETESPQVDQNRLVDKASTADCQEGEQASERGTEPPDTRGKGNRKRRKRRHKGKQGKQQDSQPVVPKKNPSLLEKLLAKEIRHERNVVLQCIRHIVNKKFFGLEQDTPDKESNVLQPRTKQKGEIDEEIWEDGV